MRIIFIIVVYVACLSLATANPTLRGLVSRWNDAHNTRATATFVELYADSLFFYGKYMAGTACAEAKRSALAKSPDFRQQIVGEITIEGDQEYWATCRFDKQVSVNGKTASYKAYLYFEKINNTWKIKSESDLTTDENIWKKTAGIQHLPPADAVAGDFNGDGKPEFMWLVPPVIITEGCTDGTCTAYLKFSDPSIPTLPVQSCIGGVPQNEGDLNQNRGHEIGLLPDWFSSCWRGYYLWTLIDGQWRQAIDPVSTHCIQWEETGMVDVVRPVPGQPGYVEIHYTEMGEDDFSIKSKIIKILK